jgi:hypothetical protein
VEPLAGLRELRDYKCRLTPDRALQSLDEAEAFLTDRGLLTRTADSALPSLYGACHERPFRPGSPGFATWPKTKWPWFGELAERGYLVPAVHGGKNMLVTGEIAALLDPICRAEIERWRVADEGARRLVDHLAAAGPSGIDDLRTELGLSPQALKSLRAPLERCGAVISRSVLMTAGDGDRHRHSSELARWDQVFPEPAAPGADPARALQDLLAAAVHASVLAPQGELRRWFSWPRYWDSSLVDGLVRAGRLRRVDGHVTTAGI